MTTPAAHETRLERILGVPLSDDVMRQYRNVTIADLRDGQATRVTDYWGEPFEAPAWRKSLADALDMPPRGVWPAVETLQSDDEAF